MKKVKSHMKWSWIFMITFFLLSALDIRFGILGLICMMIPLYHAVKGRGKVHCSHHCPRGSLFGNFLKYISLDNNLPSNLKSKTAKNILLAFLLVMFTISLITSGLDINKIGFVIFRLMIVSTILGIIMGVLFKPRSWCQVCPMGYTTGLIKEAQDKK